MHEELDKFCPSCLPVLHRKSQAQVGVRLELVRDDYSGCGVDHCICPECKQMFEVSYKVSEITPIGSDKGN